MSTTVTTYLARDLIDLGSFSGDLIGLDLFPGRAPVLIVDWPGGSAEIGCAPALAAVLLSARNSVRLDRLEEAADTLPGLSWADDPDTLRTVPELVAAALA